MLQGEHSAILTNFIEPPFVIKIFVLSIFKWPLKTGFTVYIFCMQCKRKVKVLFLLYPPLLGGTIPAMDKWQGIMLYLHLRSNPLMNLRIFETVHSLMNYTYLIDSCQAHMPMHFPSNIKFIHQKCYWCCEPHLSRTCKTSIMFAPLAVCV